MDLRRKLRRTRREARHYIAEARYLAKRRGKRLAPEARAEVEAAVKRLEKALPGEDLEELGGALKTLDLLVEAHLAVARKGVLREYTESILVAVAVALFLRAFVIEAFKIPSGSMVPTLVIGDHIFVNKYVYGIRIPFTYKKIVELGSPQRGDVVVFVDSKTPAKDVIKRVIGLPGDVVETRDQVVYVNGVPQPRTEGGEITYDERNESTGNWWSETCVRWVERLARGPLPRPASDRPEDLAAAYQAGTHGGEQSHSIVQCKRARIGEREGPFEVVAPGHVFVMGDNRDRSADSRGEGGWQVPFDHIKGRAVVVWWSWGKGGWSPVGDEGIRLERLLKTID